MSILNVEIKAHIDNLDKVRNLLMNHQAKSIGIDNQVDTYFNVSVGRLKLREGNIENNLIHYVRENKKGPKQSKILLYQSSPESNLKEILVQSIGVLTIIDKAREILFIDNIKFHLDQVKGLGEFVEIEAIDKDGSIGVDILYEQCQRYMDLFNISDDALINHSYSDMALGKKSEL